MPELPEVETIRLALQPRIENKVIKSFSQSNKNLRINISPQRSGLAKKIINKKIKAVARRGKNMLWFLDRGILLIHLGMSGKIFWRDKNSITAKHQHWQIEFSKINQKLAYVDARRFGGIAYFKNYQQIEEYLKHGPEPLQKILPKFFNKFLVQPSFDEKYIFEKTRNTSKSIKAWLMDASNVTGIGNIYASEILFLAKINPQCSASNLILNQCKLLFNATQKILTKAIKAGGSTLRDYQKVDGNFGNYQDKFLVYNRENQPCPVCRNKIAKVLISGRSTYYCKNCQK